MLEQIIGYLQAIVSPLNIYSKIHGLAEQTTVDDQLYPTLYVSSGNSNHASDFDFWDGQCYFRQTAPYTESEYEGAVGGITNIQRVYTLRLVGINPKDIYGTDNAYISDKILNNLSTAITSDSVQILQGTLRAENAYINVTSTIANNQETLEEEIQNTRFTQIPDDKVFVAIDFTVTVEGSLDCFQTWGCGDEVINWIELIQDKYCQTPADATVTNQAVTYSQAIPSGDIFALPYQEIVDSDGSTVSNIDYKPDTDGVLHTCTPCKALDEYTNQELEHGLTLDQRNSLTRLQLPKPGETPVIYDTNDLGDNNDGAPSTFLTLDVNNPSGNTDRFEVLGTDVVIDWKLRLYWTRYIQSPARVTWAVHNTNSAALTLEGLTGWRLPSVTEYSTILDAYMGDPLNYAPFNIANGSTTGANFAFFTGQTYLFNTAQIYNYVLNSSSRGYRISQTNKTGGGVALYVKNF